MVPTSYTIDSASDYLRYEVLRESADALGWGNTVEGAFRGIEVATVSANTTTVLTVPALDHAFPAGTGVTFEDGYRRLTDVAVAIGATAITVDPPITDSAAVGKKVALVYSGAVIPVRNPKYVYVIDEVLRQMELENIEQINLSNIRMFRLLARVELLRRISEGKVSAYDYTENAFSFTVPQIPFNKYFTTQQVIALYNREAQRVANELFVPAPSTLVTSGIPTESLSTSSSVALKW